MESRWLEALAIIDDAAQLARLDAGVHERLRVPQRVLEVSVPLQRDSGDAEEFAGWRVNHDTALGPATGGIRFHPDLDRWDVTALAAGMTFKNALLDLPLGGAHGGVRCDPATLSAGELERVMQRYATEILPLLESGREDSAPDLSTDAGRHNGAIAAGVLMTVRNAFHQMGMPVAGARVVIQGFGTVGKPLAFLLHSAGMRVLAVCDRGGATVNRVGLDVPELSRYETETGSVAGFPLGDDIAPDEIWSVPCELAVPAARARAIGDDVAQRLATKVVIEAANGPTTASADAVLADRGIVVIPDIVANAGGITEAYIEWAQEREGVAWEQGVASDRFYRYLEEAFLAMWARAEALGVSLRRAAHTVAIERLGEAIARSRSESAGG